MRKLHQIGIGVLCLCTLFAARLTSSAQDTVPPVLLSAVASCDGETIIVTYNEPVEPSSATDTFNYFGHDTQGTFFFFPLIATMVDPQTVLLDVSPALSPQNSYVFEVFNIMDLAGNPMIGVTVPIVFDTTPPVVTCSVALSTLFPANNMLVDVGLTATTDSSGSPVQVQVYSDEPELSFLADATYLSGVLELRARRDPGADGRVYLIVVTSTDDCGNVGTCCTTVVVPQNGSPAALSSVQAQAAAAQGQCSPSGSPSTPHLLVP